VSPTFGLVLVEESERATVFHLDEVRDVGRDELAVEDLLQLAARARVQVGRDALHLLVDALLALGRACRRRTYNGRKKGLVCLRGHYEVARLQGMKGTLPPPPPTSKACTKTVVRRHRS